MMVGAMLAMKWPVMDKLLDVTHTASILRSTAMETQ